MRRHFECKILDSGELVFARAKGKAGVLAAEGKLAVGDYVQLRELGGEYGIVSLEPRRTEVFRISLRERKKKVTAANVDGLLICSSVSKPHFKPSVVDRFLVRACQWGVEAFLVFNKMDLHRREDFDFERQLRCWRHLEVSCFEISAKFADSYKLQYLSSGVKQLKAVLKGKSVLLVGQSGVGKSTLVNCLREDASLARVGELSKKDKGAHTTTWPEIIDLPFGNLIDGPGIKSLSLDDIAPGELINYFPDLAEIARRCAFPNCTHKEGARGCAFFGSEGSDDSRASFVRLASYQRILGEISATPQWAKKF